MDARCPKCEGCLAVAEDLEIWECKCLNCGKRVGTARRSSPKSERVVPRPSASSGRPEPVEGRRSAREVQARRRAYLQRYQQRPAVRARRRAYMQQYFQRPAVQAKKRAYRQQYSQRPAVQAKKRAYMQQYYKRPAVQARQRAYQQRPAEQARRRAYMRTYMRHRREKRTATREASHERADEKG